MWIFGYGSLIWRPSFAFLEKRGAVLQGYARRFWQGSTDHRGVPGAPGRVVTLVSDPDAATWGVAYRVDVETYEHVVASLDVREKGGYERHELPLLGEGETFRALVYLAGPTNPEYLGEAPEAEIARQIASSHGPSGANAEYVVELARALRDAGATDPHVFGIETLVRALLAGS